MRRNNKEDARLIAEKTNAQLFGYFQEHLLRGFREGLESFKRQYSTVLSRLC